MNLPNRKPLVLCIVVIIVQLFLFSRAGAADILEAVGGGASGKDWNQGSQWTGAAIPSIGNNYVLYTNTSNNSTLSSYYGVSFGTGYIRTPVNNTVSLFLGDAIILPPGTEILLKEASGGSASANIIFTNYNNISAVGLYPLVRLGPNTSGGTATLDGTIVNEVDSYVANDASAAMTLVVASTVSGVSNLTLVSSTPGGTTFASTRTNLVTGDWSGFSGTLNIGNATIGGVVTLDNSAMNVNMTMAMPRTNAILVLGKAISVKSFAINNHAVPVGTYAPTQLTALGFGGIFSGNGFLAVGFTAPPGLTAIAGNGRVRLSWQPVYGAVNYYVKRSTTSGMEVTVATVNGSNYTSTGLVNGTAYFYKISAVDAAGNETVDSLEATATPNDQPSYPVILKVYLQGGQSNSDGRALTNGLPVNLLNPQDDVPLYYYLAGGAANGDGTLGALTTLRPGISAKGGGTTFGPELTFGRALADYYALTNGASTNLVMVAIIKYADGGTSLVSDWIANGKATTSGDGPDYVIFQKVVSAGLSRLAAEYPGAGIELDGMIWVQGESDIDAGSSASAAYGTNLVRFINDVRLTYATNYPYGMNLPFFLSRISDNQTVYSSPMDSDYSNYLLLRAGQQFAATNLSNVFIIDTDPMQFSTATPWANPGLHFDTQGQQSMGAAFGRVVTMALPPPHWEIPEESANGLRLNFKGVSGTLHSIERSSNIGGPWIGLTNILVGSTGMTNFQDSHPPSPAAFYRVSRP